MTDKFTTTFGKRMDNSPNKCDIYDTILRENKYNILDLGAGTGRLGDMLVSNNKSIHVTSVDVQFKSINHEPERHERIEKPIQEAVRNLMHQNRKFDCVVLSAVLHELDCVTLLYLRENLNKLLEDNAIVLVREPYYANNNQPYINKDSYLKVKACIERELNAEKISQYFNTNKLSELPINLHSKYPEELKWLNLAFVMAYGDDSWDREVREYRYAFSEDELDDIVIDLAYSSGHVVAIEEYSYLDITYKKWFKEAKIEEVFDEIAYTNNLIIVRRIKL